jgi:hypothetical protein
VLLLRLFSDDEMVLGDGRWREVHRHAESADECWASVETGGVSAPARASPRIRLHEDDVAT